jgi:hypothetical protein
MPGSLERALEGMLVPMCKVSMERAHAPCGGCCAVAEVGLLLRSACARWIDLRSTEGVE